jgi:hypothetical protein
MYAPRLVSRWPRSFTALVAVGALALGLLSAAPTVAVADPTVPATVTDAVAEAVAAPAAAVDAGIVKAADLSKFDPGNIISDAVFYDGAAMSSAQIQAFLDQKIGSCQNGLCLNVLNTTVSSRDAKYSGSTGALICSAFQGGTMRVSELIYRLQVACGISAKVILVTLQKEQGLTTSRAPSDWNLSAAMGQACPDTAPCDPAFKGVGPQLVGGVTQIKTYKAAKFGKQPGNNYIQWSPNAGCGGTNVYIQNWATASLYTYTPYQPNAAALRAGYGLGDGCSSYGNRNFYQYYVDWFGSTQGETLQILQVAGTSERFVVSQGQRWRLSTAEIAAQFTWISSVRDVSRADIDAYQDRGAAKRAIRTNSGIVWLLDSGQRLRLRDCAQAADFGWDCATLPLASDDQAARYPDAGNLERAVRADGSSWLIQSSSRREIVDLSLLPRYGIPALSAPISPAMLAEYTVSDPVLGVGVYRDDTNPYRMRTDAGTYIVPDAASGTTIARSARRLTAESFAYLKASAPMPVRMTSAGRSYVMVDDGWLEVSASEYPAALAFSSLPDGAVSGLPVSGRISGPHFVRERSDGQVYLMSGGTVQAMSAADQTWVTRTFGVNPRVWVLLDGAIGDATTTEGLVRTAAGANYLLDGARAYRLRDCTQVSAWGGNCASLPTITASKLGGYASAGTVQDLVRTPAGTTWLVQGGTFRQVLDPGILAAYGISSTSSPISTATAAKLPVGEPVIAPGVYSDGGSKRLVATQGGDFTLTAEQSVGVVRSSMRALTAASFAKITVDGALPSRMRSDARSFILTTEGWLEVSAAAYGGDGVFTGLSSKAWTGIVVAANEQRPHFVRDEVGTDEYLISGGAQPVSGAAERANITRLYGVPPKVWSVVGGALAGVRINFDLITKASSGEMFLMDGGTRYRLSGCGAVADFGRDCSNLRTLTGAQLAGTTDGGALAPLLKSLDGFVWLIQSGAKREVPDPRILAAYGIGTTATPVSAALMAQLKLGPPVLGVGMYDDRSGDVRVITGDGRQFAVPAGSRLGSVTAHAWAISPASLDLMTVEGDLPTRVRAGSQSYVLTSEGWLAVDGAAYTPLSFASIGARAVEGVPSAGSELRPHFVREQSASQVYLVSGGLGTVADQATLNWIAATYGVSTKVWVVPNGALR